MCEYCDKNKIISIREIHIPANQKISAYGRITLARDGFGSILRVKMSASDCTDGVYQNKDKFTIFETKLKYCPFCGKKLFKDPIFPEITLESAKEMHTDPLNAPQSKFWIRDEDKYFSIDNTEGKFKMERHFSKEDCLAWLAKDS